MATFGLRQFNTFIPRDGPSHGRRSSEFRQPRSNASAAHRSGRRHAEPPGESIMKLRKNLRALFAEYNAASAADKPGTALMKLKAAILALKDEATHPSLLITRADVV